jgi:hypothetical protein
MGDLDFDRLDDLDDWDSLDNSDDFELTPPDVSIERTWFARMLAQQHTQHAFRCLSPKHGGGLHELLCCAFGVADRSSGIAQAALLAPAPVELWVHPAQWCSKRAALAQEHMCSECEREPLQVLWPLLAPMGWKSEVRPQTTLDAARSISIMQQAGLHTLVEM